MLYKTTKKNKKHGTATEIQYLVTKFNLDKKKMETDAIAAIVSLQDALIITISLEIAILITDNVLLEMLIGLVVVIALIIGSNEIVGRILIKKGYEKR